MKDFRFFFNHGGFTSWYLLPTIMVSAMPGHRWICILWLRMQGGAKWTRR